MWQRLIELGVFDDFYPQRLHAAFKYLDSSDTDSFTLKVHLLSYCFYGHLTAFPSLIGLDSERKLHLFLSGSRYP